MKLLVNICVFISVLEFSQLAHFNQFDLFFCIGKLKTHKVLGKI